VDRSQLQEAFRKLNVQPTLGCFASSCNRVCERFFAKWPQIGASAVNFFAQKLTATELHFCCPPVKDAGHVIRKLALHPGTKAVLLLPAWTGHHYWGLLRKGAGWVPEVRENFEFEPEFQETGLGHALFTQKKGIRMWIGLWISQ
jgi:hypothetical protein